MLRVQKATVLKEFGVKSSSKHFKWDRILNTDFGAPIGLFRSRNVKNDGIYAESLKDIPGEVIEIGYNKYGECDVVGRYNAEGLVPRNGPTNFTLCLH